MIVFVAKIHHFAKKKYSKKYGQGKLWKFFQKDFEEESYEIVKTNIPVNQQFFITLDLFEMSFLFVGKFHQKAI
jgi:hypothetical protein